MFGPDQHLIADDFASFVRGPVSAFLGTVDAMGTPDVARVIGVVGIDSRRMRILVSGRAATALRNASVGARVAVLITDITTYRSMQWKGRVESATEPPSPGDTVLTDQHIHAFTGACSLVGIDPDEAWRMFPLDGVPLVIVVDESYDQTPGPGAGAPIRTLT